MISLNNISWKIHIKKRIRDKGSVTFRWLVKGWKGKRVEGQQRRISAKDWVIFHWPALAINCQPLAVVVPWSKHQQTEKSVENTEAAFWSARGGGGCSSGPLWVLFGSRSLIVSVTEASSCQDYILKWHLETSEFRNWSLKWWSISWIQLWNGDILV